MAEQAQETGCPEGRTPSPEWAGVGSDLPSLGTGVPQERLHHPPAASWRLMLRVSFAPPSGTPSLHSPGVQGEPQLLLHGEGLGTCAPIPFRYV